MYFLGDFPLILLFHCLFVPIFSHILDNDDKLRDLPVCLMFNLLFEVTVMVFYEGHSVLLCFCSPSL